jgi:hypothetical protein
LLLQEGAGAPRAANVMIGQAVIAGWTGRDAEAVEKHIKGLEALGVKRPATTPIFYRVGVARLTTDASIEVLGEKSSGEVEFVLLQMQGALWVGTGSDHWDRLVLRSHATIGGARVLYQQGLVSAMRHPEDLLARFDRNGLPDGTLMFCGTLPVQGGLRPAHHFEFELEDPVKGRTIRHGYDVVSLAMFG